ncbi:RHOMBOID-like protein 12, mitochondrial isoform X2 [Salvia miltiorrhiza]|uniref:RHOMBOID-like protein 12, mitochondrial isoform X2 n=1 Tax=Salvia miltiorrhiza TaxID=226208 RepID=UPI0025AC9E68|nr:RHOMBOID-like protein 12, mitochondrial isoform X2 [Salvia miltiorrhiza]XP_057791820.1 RHOMBOID-like protein 12, mitochondrial isoform X2 [Salvia miltiorrhiza]XP_057791821.1 RHOMBOID-like protein 12, mitochondrial isoform X2 [Salvia miltiorrhiza]XP_057791822.1 RHOMBOID-like protein 12, mitochondrial isoform X2 [Salvia miltiorrhiza]
MSTCEITFQKVDTGTMCGVIDNDECYCPCIMESCTPKLYGAKFYDVCTTHQMWPALHNDNQCVQSYNCGAPYFKYAHTLHLRNTSRKFGPKYLLKLYLGGAIGGSMGFLVYQAFIAPLVEVKQAEIRHSDLQGLGASAAVGAIMVHDILLLPPVGALLGGVFLIGMEMLSRWTLLIKIYGMPPNMRLEWEWEKKENAGARAHLGGAAAGGLAWLWKRKGRFGRF